MGVGADNGADAPVEIATDGDFFRGGFGVDFDHDDGGKVGVLSEEGINGAEGAVVGIHEHASDDGNDGEGSSGGFEGGPSTSGTTGSEVEGADDSRFEVEEAVDVFLIPGVVAEGDDVGSGVEEGFGDGWGNATSRSGVFRVDDDGVDEAFLFHRDGDALEGIAPGGADDVTYMKDSHKGGMVGGEGVLVNEIL